MSSKHRMEAWIDRVEESLAALAGPEYATVTATPWRERASSPAVHVTLYGPYDAGKTTLIKRLLVEEGVKPPAWLTISGRPETTISGAVQAGPLTYHDTPGTASGTTTHDDGAASTAMLTDVLLITMTPRLFSDADGDGGPLLQAAREHGRAARFVITQSDRIGVDPVEQPDEHRELVGRKKAELAELLSRAGLQVPAAEIHAVSGDPFGTVGSDPEPSAEDYGDGARWDGIPELRAHLGELPAYRADLRLASGARYWHDAGRHALAAADATIEQLRSGIAEAEKQLERARQGLEEIEVVDKHARSELLRDIATELHSATIGVANPSVDAVLPVVEQRLQDRIGRWAAVWSGKLQQAAETAVERLPQGLAAPTVNLRAYLHTVARAASADKPAPGSHLPLAKIVGRAERDTRTLSEAVFQHHHNMSIEVAKAELDRFRQVEPGKLKEYLDAGGRIADADTSKVIEKGLRTSETLTRVVPTIVELGGLFAEGIQGYLYEQQVQRDRQRLRTQVDSTAREITEVITADESAGGLGWGAAVSAARRALTQSAPDENLPQSLRTDLTLLRTARATFAQVLADQPA